MEGVSVRGSSQIYLLVLGDRSPSKTGVILESQPLLNIQRWTWYALKITVRNHNVHKFMF